jgi:hypothetical protein
MRGLVGSFDSAIDVRQLRSGECGQAQPDSVMHINAIGFHNDQKNKTVVFALAGGQAKFHVTQEMDCAVGPDTDSVFRQDQNHRLRDRIFIQPIQDSIHPVDCLLRGIVFPADRPMGLQQIIREAIIGSRTVPTEWLSKNGFSPDRRETTKHTDC